MTRAFIFPGQGSQAVGMGRALAEAFPIARQTFEEIDDALEQRLSRLMFEGPAEELTLTANAQPALMAVSLAVLRVIEQEGRVRLGHAARFVAGHSLGEYSALAAARSLAVTDTARLLRIRGRAMQEAVPVGEGAMAALLGLDLDAARAVAEEAARGPADGSAPGGDERGGAAPLVCETANDNSPGQIVISGHRAAIDRALAIAASRGARRSVLLPVSAPFHCALMAPAAAVMESALAEVDIRPPVVPLVANVSATPIEEPEAIRDSLVRQVTGMVRWRESVEAMRDAGVGTFVELGAGKVLSGLVRRIDRDLAALSVGEPGDIEALLKTL